MNYDEIKTRIDTIAAASDPVAVLEACFPDPEGDYEAGPLADWTEYLFENLSPDTAFEIYAPYLMKLCEPPVGWPNGKNGEPLPGLLLSYVAKRADRDPRWANVALDIELAFDKPLSWSFHVMEGLELDPEKVAAGLAQDSPSVQLLHWLADRKDERCRAPLRNALAKAASIYSVAAYGQWLASFGDKDAAIEEAVARGLHMRNWEGKLDHDQADVLIGIMEQLGGFESEAHHTQALAGLDKVKIAEVRAPAKARKALQDRVKAMAP